jgi:hypothetical protein
MQIDLTENQEYTFKTYSSLYAITTVSVAGAEYYRDFHLMLGVEPVTDGKGVDNNGSRSCGQALATVISNYKRPEQFLKKIAIGDVIITPFGTYKVDYVRYAGCINRDHLTLTELAQEATNES